MVVWEEGEDEGRMLSRSVGSLNRMIVMKAMTCREGRREKVRKLINI